MNLTKRLKVTPGSQLKLAEIDPSFHGKWKDSDDAKPELDRNLSRITALQRKLYADRGHSLLVVLQGIDGAGKDGTCWHVISAMDPQGVHVQGFKQPTAEERDHDFLWRIHPHAPARGRVAIFNSFPTFPRKNSWRGSRSGSTIPGGSGRSATAIIPSAIYGATISMHSRPRCRDVRPSTRRGLSFRLITSGFAISPSRKSPPTPLMI